MARPIKPSIEYFPLDVVMDTKFELIEAEFQLTGFAIVVKLLQRVYGEQGYYCEWNDEVALLFARKNGVGVNVVSEIVRAALKRGIFDKEMFERFGILTSKGIQRRYLKAKKYDISKLNQAYLLLSAPITTVSEEKTGVSEEKTRVFGVDNPIKKSKVKESKVKESVCCAEAAQKPTPTLEEVTAYAEERKSCVDPETFYSYYKSQGWKNHDEAITDWKARFRYWEKKERKRSPGGSGIKPTAFSNYEQPIYTDDEINEILEIKKARQKK